MLKLTPYRYHPVTWDWLTEQVTEGLFPWYGQPCYITRHLPRYTKGDVMMSDTLTVLEAFKQAGTACFVGPCKAKTLYVIMTDDYIYPSCGDHLTLAIREVTNQYDPPIDSVTVYRKP